MGKYNVFIDIWLVLIFLLIIERNREEIEAMLSFRGCIEEGMHTIVIAARIVAKIKMSRLPTFHCPQNNRQVDRIIFHFSFELKFFNMERKKV